ncbi:hypothetical protein GCM10020366_64200 [Saccharopolyspora gregorii]|uniref:Uncharacterized protein n=1 Tax=Saccharopolyspora gregorii TaxID=33914 RepID=A0ABP6S1B9_9PSEU
MNQNSIAAQGARLSNTEKAETPESVIPDVQPASYDPMICSSLTGFGLSAASMARAVAARAAGWVGVAVSAGCALQEAKEAEKNLSPEDRAYLQSEINRFANMTSDQKMESLGCVKVHNEDPGTDSASTQGYYWKCPTDHD